MELTKITETFILTIFGASGDLAKLKIFPAIYELANQHRLQNNFIIYGFARSKKTNKEFKKIFKESIIKQFGKNTNYKILDELLKHIHYFSGQYDNAESYNQFFKEVKNNCTEKDTQKIQFIGYYAVPPNAFNSISNNLSKFKDLFNFKLILEKPFGKNEKSAKKMFDTLKENFNEKQIYLLDHYLGKESVQSITFMRYTNSIINHLLKGDLIKYIQIIASEDFGIKKRGNYFDHVGIIKDMMQSHMLQLLALITMKMPNTLNAESIHREKYNILSALKFEKENALMKGQYKSYTTEENIPKSSQTETFAAMKLYIDQTDWAKIPIYIKTGKKLAKKSTYIKIVFNKLHFQENIENLKHNKLIIELQPKPNLYFVLTNKLGGSYKEYHQVAPKESLECFGNNCLPEHGRLLLDVLKNERMHFLSCNEVIACWNFIDKILKENETAPIEIYEDNSEGPKNQNQLLKTDKYIWHKI